MREGAATRIRPASMVWVSESSDAAVAAVLVADGGRGVCWFNRRAVPKSVLWAVELWAHYVLACGWRFAALRAEEVAALARELTAA